MRNGGATRGRGHGTARNLSKYILPAATAALLISRASALHAAAATWDGNAAIGAAGNGTSWTSAANWTTNGVIDALPSAIAPGDDLNFGNGTVGTINLGGNQFANSLNFTAGFTLDAPASINTLTLTSGTVGVGSSVSATVNANLAGTNGLTLSGSGTLTLTGAANYTGATTINGGTLAINGASSLAGGSLNINPSGAVVLNASTTIDSAVASAGAFKISPGQTFKLASSTDEFSQSGGQTEIGAGGLLDPNDAISFLVGGTMTLDAGVSPGRFRPSFIYCGGTSNTVTIASSPVGAGQLPGFVDLGAGNPVFSIAAGSQPVQMNVSASIANGRLTKSGAGVLEISGNNSYTGGTSVIGTLLVGAANSIPSTGAISVQGNGLVQLASGIGAVTTQGLTIARTGQLDLANNHLFIHYLGGVDPISTIANYVAAGFNNGAWNGNGTQATGAGGAIISSSAAANSASYGIGYADSADPGNPAGLPAGTIEIKYTLLGDANLDGKVNGTDFAILATNFNQAVTSWDQGDFNYDSKANGSDFAFISSSFNQGSSGAADSAALNAFAAANGLVTSVPEPGCASFALIVAAGFLRVRSRTPKRK